MKLAVVSDLHLGHPFSVLLKKDAAGQWHPSGRFELLAATVCDATHLVLLGDILDLSVSEYHDVFSAAKIFFLLLQQRGFAGEVIYVPGNHDFDIWHAVEYEVNVIDRLRRRKEPRKFRMSVPGIIDDRPGAAGTLLLHGVRDRAGIRGGRYGGLVFDNIAEPEGHAISFNFAYPNLILVTGTETILMSHGHYLEPWWTITSEYGLPMAGNELGVPVPCPAKELVEFNTPLSVLACSGMGQAGIFTQLVRRLIRDKTNKNYKEIKLFASKLAAAVFHRHRIHVLLKPLVWVTLKLAVWFLMRNVKNSRPARYSEQFLEDARVRERFSAFIHASELELQQVNQAHHIEIPALDTCIFGHTHQPIGLADKAKELSKFSDDPHANCLRVFNTGGWLHEEQPEGGVGFCGAEIFIHETGKPLISKRIN